MLVLSRWASLVHQSFCLVIKSIRFSWVQESGCLVQALRLMRSSERWCPFLLVSLSGDLKELALHLACNWVVRRWAVALRLLIRVLVEEWVDWDCHLFVRPGLLSSRLTINKIEWGSLAARLIELLQEVVYIRVEHPRTTLAAPTQA